jgi:hypothetical protein
LELEKGISVTRFDLLNYRQDSSDIIPLFYQTGYLTIKETDEYGNFILGYPNKEVQIAFERELLDYVLFELTDGMVASKLMRALTQKDLYTFFMSLTSYFAGLSNKQANKTEANYSALFTFVLKLIANRVFPEQDQATGRPDIVAEFTKYTYIFELKAVNTKDKIKIQEAATKALEQIENKDYGLSYETNPTNKKPVVKIAVIFSTISRTIEAWQEVGDSDGIHFTRDEIE